jgi:hypothetical protein
MTRNETDAAAGIRCTCPGIPGFVAPNRFQSFPTDSKGCGRRQSIANLARFHAPGYRDNRPDG